MNKALDESIASLINSEHETLVRSNSEDEYVLHMNQSSMEFNFAVDGGTSTVDQVPAQQAKCQKIMQPESLSRVYGKAKCMQGIHTAQLLAILMK